ncbi:hypothetical protein [Terriglobus roseus]|nr:hypothetical protein [Terriglobus roseus]
MRLRDQLVPALIFGALIGCLPSLRAQTADPGAAPPNPSTAAPAARADSYSVQKGELIVAPGLRIPNGNVPWVLDTVDGKQVLVPVHHAAINGSVIEGVASKTPLHSASPIFFVHTSDRTENTGDSGRGIPTGWALLPITLDGTTRTVTRPKFSEVNGATVCAPPVLCTTAESLAEGWLRILPKTPLTPGEYALLPVQRSASTTGNLVVYDFTIDGGGPKAKDEVSAGQNLDSTKKKKRIR